jgi:NitT/TauT family transport system ATP-binding protein
MAAFCHPVAFMTALSVSVEQKSFARSDGALKVLEGIHIDVAQDEFVAVLAPSGCGKTTLLQIAAGLDKDFSGSVQYAPGIAQNLAYVFQSPCLLPWRTVRENIALVLNDASLPPGAIDKMLADVGLPGSQDLYPSQLSLGMQRRVSLARAFMLRPKLLFMDEPFVSIDEEMALRLRQLLKALLARNPATTIFVTHDWREALMLADRLLFLGDSPARITGELTVSLDQQQRQDPKGLEMFHQEHLELFRWENK